MIARIEKELGLMWADVDRSHVFGGRVDIEQRAGRVFKLAGDEIASSLELLAEKEEGAGDLVSRHLRAHTIRMTADLVRRVVGARIDPAKKAAAKQAWDDLDAILAPGSASGRRWTVADVEARLGAARMALARARRLEVGE